MVLPKDIRHAEEVIYKFLIKLAKKISYTNTPLCVGTRTGCGILPQRERTPRLIKYSHSKLFHFGIMGYCA